MNTQRDDLVFEIQDLQTEIDEHVRKINQLKSAIQVKEQQLQEYPITLDRIIAECMVGYSSVIYPEVIENILDRVEVELLSQKVMLDEEQPLSVMMDYRTGWENCIKYLKGRLRE
jgi:hypothetical protein